MPSRRSLIQLRAVLPPVATKCRLPTLHIVADAADVYIVWLMGKAGGEVSVMGVQLNEAQWGERVSCQRQSSTSNITPFSVRSITYNPSALLTFPSKNICKSSLKVSDLCLFNETKMTYTSSMPSDLTEDALSQSAYINANMSL
ncbi:uncharacterized protein Dyak_GE28208 [Drosophila yakuba]|uniref:Uncharacterized protein n=1 Tax=Drosophila yakuba TaxID=7245 RepID=A0A0R1EB16_DROYA|nr:uncharacterized protein Dyak_GE28208 [Drosophila yakuba]